MKSSVTYEEDLFLLKGLIKYWTEGMRIQADPELFSGKLMDDMDFIDSLLGKTFAALQASPNLIHRGEIFHNLAGAEAVFITCLDLLIKGEAPLALPLTNIKDHIASMRSQHQDRLIEIRKMLKRLTHGENQEEEEDLITPMEMEILFRKDDEN